MVCRAVGRRGVTGPTCRAARGGAAPYGGAVNVMALTDSSGAVVEKVKYDPYGQPTVSQVGQAPATGNPFLFQGQRYCPETGLYYFKNRDYLPPLGRFLQRDPLGYVDGMNVYEVLGGKPAFGVDPLGQENVDTLDTMIRGLVQNGYTWDSARRIAKSQYKAYVEVQHTASLLYGPCKAQKNDTCCTSVRHYQGYPTYWSCVKHEGQSLIAGGVKHGLWAATLVAKLAQEKAEADVAVRVAAGGTAGAAGVTAAGAGAVVWGGSITVTAAASLDAGRYLSVLVLCAQEECVNESRPEWNKEDGCWKCPAWQYELAIHPE